MLDPETVVNRGPIGKISGNAALTALAQRVQPVVARALQRSGPAVRNILHGTFLGHPVHPVITDIPVGAWTVTAVLDTLELAGGPQLAGADAALVIGVAGASGAAVTGLADWSYTSKGTSTLGMAHALLNSTALLMYLTALGLRRTQRPAGLWLALAAYGVVAAGAYLGGELSYSEVIGPQRTAEPLFASDTFTRVLSVADVPADKPARADFGGIPILVSRTADGVAAILAACTHRGGPLADGEFADGCVRCPWHGSIFSLADGKVREGPAAYPQPRFDARINGDGIEVRAFTG